MSRLANAFVFELRQQPRYGLWAVSVLVVLAAAVLALAVPASARAQPQVVASVATLGLVITTTFFAGVLSLVERRQGVHEWLATTPLRPAEGLAARLGALTVLATVETVLVLLVWAGPSAVTGRLVLACALLGLVFAATGVAVIARFDRFDAFLAPAIGVVTLLVAPVVAAWFGAAGAFAWHPTGAALAAMREGSAAAGSWLVMGAWLAVLAPIALRAHVRAQAAVDPASESAAPRRRVADRTRRGAGPLRAAWSRSDLARWVPWIPLVLAVALRLAWPSLEARLAGLAPDLPWGALLAASLAGLAPATLGLVAAFVWLEARESRVLEVVLVSPTPLWRFLLGWISLPTLLSVAVGAVALVVADLAPLTPGEVVLAAVLAAPLAPVMALVVAALARDQLGGFALLKVANGVNLVPIVAIAAGGGWAAFAALLPSYWPMRYVVEAAAGSAAPSTIVATVAVAVAWTLALAWATRRRVLREAL